MIRKFAAFIDFGARQGDWRFTGVGLGSYPDSMAPIIKLDSNGARNLTMMRWGFPPPPKGGPRPVTNVRNTKSSYWRNWLKTEYRCLVPATSFCEWTDSRPKVPHWFALDEQRTSRKAQQPLGWQFDRCRAPLWHCHGFDS